MLDLPINSKIEFGTGCQSKPLKAQVYDLVSWYYPNASPELYDLLFVLLQKFEESHKREADTPTVGVISPSREQGYPF